MINISWAQYWSVIIVSLILYYGFVLVVYYRSDLLLRFQPGVSLKQAKKNFNTDDDPLLPVVQSLTDEMTAYLEQAANKRAVKEEIIFAMQQLTSKYKGIKDTRYQNAVNSLLQFECGSKCAVHLDEEEIRQVWMDHV